jgi:hypothetical protein
MTRLELEEFAWRVAGALARVVVVLVLAGALLHWWFHP